MHDVKASAEFTSQLEKKLDCLVLRCTRARREPRGISPYIRSGYFLCGLHDWTRQFSVDEQRYFEFSQLRKCRPKIGLGNLREFLDAARHEKAFEAKHAAFPQRPKFADISGNDAAPKADVHPKFSCCRCQFFAECRCGRRCGNAVERHFDQSYDSASRSSTSGRRKTFPFRAARLVDVDVGVDDSPHHNKVVSLVYEGALR